jgi:hypothetical protein
MKLLRVCALVIAVAVSACASTQFKSFEGRSNIVEGQGGTKVVVDGMDVWDNGDPPRRFQLLGIIEDERPGGILPMSQLRSDMVKKAREVGGTALIQIRSESQIMGYQSTGSATGTSFGNTTRISGTSNSIALRKNAAAFAVIKYVD